MSGITSNPPSNLLYNQEKLSQYCVGGYHPTQLGDRYKDGRYKVVHKLGWGGFSTVWLAKDEDLQNWVALKIGKARNSALRREVAVLQALRERRASEYIPSIYDVFTHEGPNGSHLCIVTDLLGPSLARVIAYYHQGGDCLDSADILRLTKQLLQAVSAIHEAGHFHGDISSANIAFTASKLANLTEDAIFDIIGHPESASLCMEDGIPLPAKPAKPHSSKSQLGRLDG